MRGFCLANNKNVFIIILNITEERLKMNNDESIQNYQSQSESQVAQQPEASPTLQPPSGLQDAAVSLDNNQPPKKNNSKNFIVIIAAVVAIVVVIIVMVVLMNSGNDNSSQGSSQAEPEERSDVTLSVLQRDTQRRDDTSRFISQLNQYQANNGGQVPHLVSTGDEVEAYNSFIDEYLKSSRNTFSDPLTGEDYEVVQFTKCSSDECVDAVTDGDIEAGKILVYSNAKCIDDIPTFIAGDRKVAITMALEAGGMYCINN